MRRSEQARRRARLASVGLALVAGAWPGAAHAAVSIDGFIGDAPPSGGPVPQATVGPGQRLTSCARPDALGVVYAYRGLDPSVDAVQVVWFSDGASFFTGTALAPEGRTGRAFRSLSPGLPNGNYRADVLVDGTVAASATVTKDCPGAPVSPYATPPAPPPTTPTVPRVGGRYGLTLTGLTARTPDRARRTRLTAVCVTGPCDALLAAYGRTVRASFNGERYAVAIDDAGTADCVRRSDGAVLARNAFRLRATITWRVVRQRQVGAELVATGLGGRWTEVRVPNALGRAARCRQSTSSWQLDAVRIGS